MKHRMQALQKFLRTYPTETAALLLFVLLVAQRTIFGFHYFPMSDDWFLYYGRSAMENPVAALELTTRPLAGLLDVFLITPLSGHLILIELLLLLMLSASVYFLCKAFISSKISSGGVLMAVIALSPIGFEGLYWIAASSRIIPSLFFISLCIYSESMYTTVSKKRYLALFMVSGLFSVGFYEMMIPIYFALTVIVMLKHRKKLWILIFPVVFTVAAILYYKLNMGDTSLAVRGKTVTKELFSYHIWDLWDWYKRVLGSIQLQLFKESFLDGAKALVNHPAWAVSLAAVSAGLAAAARGRRNHGKLWYDLLMGMGLIAAAISVMVLLYYVRMPFRVVYPLCIGGALIAESVLCRILPGRVYKAAAFVLIFCFCVCNIGQLGLYRWNSRQDEAFCAQVMEKTDAVNPDKLVYIFNKQDYWYTGRVQHYEYVKGITENYACITGMVRYRAGTPDTNNIMTVADEEEIKLYDLTGSDVETYYIDKTGELQPCYVVKSGANYDILSDTDGYIGSLTRDHDSMRYDAYSAD